MILNKEHKVFCKNSMHDKQKIFIFLCICGLMVAAVSVYGRTSKLQADKENTYNIAILRDNLDGLNISFVDKLTSRLRERDFNVTAIDFEALSRRTVLNTTNFDCLILTESTAYPAFANKALVSFAESGGDLILMGGHAFKQTLWKSHDSWKTISQVYSSLQEQQSKESIRLNFERFKQSNWRRGAKDLTNPSMILPDKGAKGNGIRIDIKSITDDAWDTFTRKFKRAKRKHNAFVFYAKATKQTQYMAIEVVERDHARWMYVAELSCSWKKYTVIDSQFSFFKDASPANRGKENDKLNLRNTRKISFGLVPGVSPFVKGDHTIWIDEVGTVQLDIPENFGKAQKGVTLPVFDDADHYKMAEITSIVKSEGQDIITEDANVTGNFEGTSAVGFEYPDQSAYIPILNARDKFGRDKGFAGGVLVHYDGKYKDGQWAIFGITSEEFYSSDKFIGIIDGILTRFKKHDIGQRLKRENKISKNKKLKVLSAAPEGFIRLSEDKSHFVYPNGRKFFALGCNYIGSFDRKCRHGISQFDADYLEEDFKKASAAGINLFRFWNSGIDGSPENTQTLLELARKYGIYLILMPSEHPKPTDKKTLAILERCVRQVKDETIVLGYDLMNEPYITSIGSVLINGKPGKIAKFNAYDRYSNEYFDRKWVDQLARTRNGWPKVDDWVSDRQARKILAAHFAAQKYLDRLNTKNFSLLYSVEKDLSGTDGYYELFDAINDNFSDWIKFQKEAIRQKDENHFITIGYNTPLAALKANESVDFISHHIYNVPYTYDNFQDTLTTFDRLRKLWPSQPVMCGEFGYSSGLKMPDGTYLDPDSAGIAEILMYLYAFAHDYSGALLWMVSEWPVANMAHNGQWIAEEDRVRQSRYGLYYYDGTRRGKPKPIAHATRFFRTYIDNHQSGQGSLTVTKAKTPIQTGYIYKNIDALFVGDVEYKSRKLSFKSKTPVSVMLSWDKEKINIMATADVTATIDPATMGFNSSQKKDVEGKVAGFEEKNGKLSISLLEGEIVKIY